MMVNLTPAPTPEQWRRGILHSIEGLHREGMTAVKDPDDTQPMWDAYRELLNEHKLDEHVFVLWHAGSTHGIRAAGSGADFRASQTSRFAGRRPVAFRRRKNLHGWQRRRAHCVDAPALE